MITRIFYFIFLIKIKMPKHLEIVILVCCLLLLNGKNIQCKSLDEQVGSKYQFDLFENEEGSKSLYKSEKIHIKKLFKMRKILDIFKIQIQQFRQLQNFQNGIKKHIEIFLHNQTRMLQDVNKITNEFPIVRDYNGEFF